MRAVLRKRGYVEKHYKGNLLPSKNKKNDSDDSDDDDSCDSGDDSDNDTTPCNKEKNTKASSNLPAKSRRPSKAKTRTINVSKNKADDDGSACDDSDDDSTDNEDWKAGYEANGPDCEFSLMVSEPLLTDTSLRGSSPIWDVSHRQRSPMGRHLA